MNTTQNLHLDCEKSIATLHAEREEQRIKFDARHADFLTERQKAWDLEGQLSAASKELDAQRNLHQTDIENLKLVIAERTVTIRALVWELHYRDEYPAMPNIEAADLKSMIPQLDQCIAVLQSAALKEEKILTHIIELLGLLGEGTSESFLAAFVQTHVQYPLARITHLLNEEKADPRSAIVTFYTCYQLGRIWIQNGLLALARFQKSESLSIPEQVSSLVANIPHYRDWWNADQALFAELDKLLTIRHLIPVKTAIQNHNDKNTFVRALPAAMQPK